MCSCSSSQHQDSRSSSRELTDFPKTFKSKMSFLYGLQSATRNRFLSGVNSLANWRQWNPPAGCPHPRRPRVVNASRRLNTVSQCHLVTLLPGNFHFCRTLSNKKSRCFLNAQNQEMGLLTYKRTVWGDSFPRHGVREVVGGPALTASCLLSCPAVRAAPSFHTSPRVLAAPVPLLLLILKPVQKLLAIIVGRGIRKWWQALPPNKKELFKDSVKKNKWKLLLGLSASGLLFVVFYFTHLEVSPVTGRSKLLLLGKEHFRLLSDLEYKVYMFDRPYSRTLEAEADKIGLQLAAKALKLREVCNCPPLSGPDPRLLFKLTVKRFLEESEKEDLNVTVFVVFFIRSAEPLVSHLFLRWEQSINKKLVWVLGGGPAFA
ncbi:hypothetical protein A6R68_05042 [Neotoma lepida]|uniref:Uncharacterized protein n=1 Tax=Neotoma lepida TaxID=56216 RepID=A0A1A6GM52_NEOLE|nr:hypothetical protein A6R68_05042 [Neotoma lepida]